MNNIKNKIKKLTLIEYWPKQKQKNKQIINFIRMIAMTKKTLLTL